MILCIGHGILNIYTYMYLISFWRVVRGNKVHRCEKQLSHKEKDTESYMLN